MYCFCIVCIDCRELLGQSQENIRRLMQQTVANELSPTRSPNNMMLITVIFQQSPDLAAKVPLFVLHASVVLPQHQHVMLVHFVDIENRITLLHVRVHCACVTHNNHLFNKCKSNGSFYTF